MRLQLSQQRSYRAAVVVSKKVAASAVVRNRIRRRLYERLRTETVLLGRPVDLVLYVKQPQVATISSEDLDREFQKILRAGLDKLQISR